MPGRNDFCPCGSGKKFKKCCVELPSERFIAVPVPPSPPRPASAADVMIDHFCEHELLRLNRRIVARVNAIRQAKIHKEMIKFRIGERVVFDRRDGEPVHGVLVRLNRKTVTVISDDGGHWNVSPQALASTSDYPTTKKEGIKLLALPESMSF